MVKQIVEPNNNQIDRQSFLDFIARTTKQGGGFICIGLTNLNTTGKPDIERGSRLEVNGAFYEVESDEPVSGSPSALAWDRNNYIYAVPSNKTLSFVFSDEDPTWSAAKGGWYNNGSNGNNRAIAKFFFTDGWFSGKIILDSYNAISAVNTKQTIPTSGGAAVFNISSVTENATYILQPGLYRYSVKGGDSGKGGAGGSGGYGTHDGVLYDYNSNPNSSWTQIYNRVIGAAGQSGTPQSPNAGVTSTGVFRHYGGPIKVKVGADGGDGPSGGYGINAGMPSPTGQGNQILGDGKGGTGGGGGGGGSGIESRIGEIVVQGGPAGVGGRGEKTLSISGTNLKGSGTGGSGGFGVSGPAGDGSLGDYSPYPDDYTYIGQQGKPAKTTTGGYARLYRVG